MSDKKYDVVIYKLIDKTICALPGTQMKLDSGFYTARKCYALTFDRIDLVNFSAAIVPAGKYAIQDVLDEKDVVE